MKTQTNSRRKEKTIQDLEVEIESIKKTQTEGNLKVKNLGNQTGTSEASLSNRILRDKDRNSGIEDTIEEMGTSVTENVK